MSTINTTHRKRLARALSEQEGIPYLTALDRVARAAAEDRLPKRLDDAGMRAALRILTTASAYAEAATPSDEIRRPTVADVRGWSASQGSVDTPAQEEARERRIAADPRDQQIYDLSAVYEQATGSQGLLYISSPGIGKDKYVFGGVGGGHVCLGREEALAHISGLVTQAGLRWTEPGADPVPVEVGGECGHPATVYRSQEGTYCDACGKVLVPYRELVETDAFHLEKSSLRLLRQVWQGRVAWEKHGTRTPGFRFTIDNEPASDIRDIELRWLRDHDYLTAPPLGEGEEWAVARTTEWGEDVLAFHGADRDRFHDGLPEASGPRTFTVTFADMQRCPIKSMGVSHYRNDGTCLCFPDPSTIPPFSTEGTTTATVRGLLKVRDTFLDAGRVEWWWHIGPHAGSHGFKTVEGIDPEDGDLIFRDEDPDWMEPVTRLSLDYIDDPDKAARHLIWPDHTGVTLCDKRTGAPDATYKVAAAEPERD